jgi:hypothetical protein
MAAAYYEFVFFFYLIAAAIVAFFISEYPRRINMYLFSLDYDETELPANKSRMK